MKKLLLILLFIFEAHSAGFLNLATVPWRSESDLVKLYRPLIKLIEKDTKKRVNFFITKDYGELSKRIKAKSVDIAIFGANSYVDAKKANPHIIYLATSMQPGDHYNSIIISRKDSKIKDMQDLKGVNFGFTDKGSTSGYVYPNIMLIEAGIDPKKDFKTVSMLKKHYKVYDAVAKGAIDAGGCTISNFKKAVERNGDIYRILKKSDPIPQDPIVAAPHLDKKIVKILKESFKNANKTPYFKEFKSDLKGLSVKDDSYYDIVRKAKKFMGK